MSAYERYDEDVAGFWDAVGGSGLGKASYALRHPRTIALGLAAIRRLPVLTASPSAAEDGAALARTLRQRGVTTSDFRLFGAAVLAVPPRPEGFLCGRRQQTARRMVAKARRAGLRCRAVTAEERAELLALANHHEQRHPDDSYRVLQPDNADLLDYDLWRMTVDADGTPLLLCVVPVDGAWAVLRYFRRLGTTPRHTLARWVATYDIVEQVGARGVRHLLDPEHPGRQTNGLRHFQRMLGFRYVRIHLNGR